MDAWTLVFDGWDPADEGRREALCTLGNGRFATRGAVPESAADGAHYPGTYAAGIFNRLSDRIAGTLVETESMVNLPNWLELRFAVGDGPWVELGSVRVLSHRTTLDLRRGVLSRHLRFEDAAGRRMSVRQRRFVHMARPHLAGLQTVLCAEGWGGPVRVRSAIDARVVNDGVRRYRGMANRHLQVASTSTPQPDTVALVARTTQSGLVVAQAARTRLCRGGTRYDPPRTPVDGPDQVGHELVVELRDGEPVTVDKLVALVTSQDPAICEPGLAAEQLVAEAEGFDELLVSHELAWRQLWRRFRMELSDGPATGPDNYETLRTLRLCAFHMLQTVSRHNLALDAGIPARGLHGEAYRGHVFWDELFVLPMLTLRLPGLARALLGYRVRRLDAARRAARAAGHTGALYPWQSGSEGREASQRVHLNPLSGRWLPDTSHLQRHVGLAVAYNIWQYYQATDDLEFLADHGAEPLLEVARFFAGLAEYDPVRGRYRIRGVMGPDEYSTRYPGAERPGVDDNAYTNMMTVWVLMRAADLLEVLPATRRAELVESLGLDADELARWDALSRRMYLPIGPDGIIEQFEGYRSLRELDWADYRRRYGDISRLDRILESEGRSVDEYQVSKQADVLMLFYLLSADELRALLGRLGYALAPEAIPRTIDYYLARAVHGSTLSALVHAWVLARGNRHRELEYFDRALHSDIADIQGGTTAEGIHLGAMAGCVDLLQRCFAGLETRDDTLWFNPHWPVEFGRLEMAVQYRGQALTVRVSDRLVQVSADPARVARCGWAAAIGCVSCDRGRPSSCMPASSPLRAARQTEAGGYDSPTRGAGAPPRWACRQTASAAAFDSAIVVSVGTAVASGHGSASRDMAAVMAASASDELGALSRSRAAASGGGAVQRSWTSSALVCTASSAAARRSRSSIHEASNTTDSPSASSAVARSRSAAYTRLVVPGGRAAGGSRPVPGSPDPTRTAPCAPGHWTAGPRRTGRPARRPAWTSGSGQPTHQDEPHRAALEVGPGQIAVALDVTGGAGVALFVAQTRDLGPHERAIGHIVMPQRRRGRVSAELGVVDQEPLGEFGVAQPLQVHGQEAHVIQTVDVAQPVIELQAVQCPRPVGQTEHVVGEQVTVPVQDPPGGDPRLEQRGSAGEEPQRQQLDVTGYRVVQDTAAEPPGRPAWTAAAAAASDASPRPVRCRRRRGR